MTADGLGGGGGEMGEGVSDAMCISLEGFILLCARNEVHYVHYDVYLTMHCLIFLIQKTDNDKRLICKT